MADMDITTLMDAVQVKNRIVDGMVRITFDGKQIEWAPGQSRQLPRKLAEWFVNKSLYCFYPGDVNEGLPSKAHYKLVIVGMANADESDITRAQVANVKELLDVASMPELTRIDPQTGKPMRRVYIDPRSTGANDMETRQAEQAATKTISSAIVKDAANKIADAAAGASDAEIVEAVTTISGKMERAGA